MVEMPGADHRYGAVIRSRHREHPIGASMDPEPSPYVIAEIEPEDPAESEVRRALAELTPAAGKLQQRIPPERGQPAAQQPPIAPGRNLGLECGTDAHQREAFGQEGEADVVGGVAQVGFPETPLAFLDGFPAFVE